jgi:hypothetical protein
LPAVKEWPRISNQEILDYTQYDARRFIFIQFYLIGELTTNRKAQSISEVQAMK